MGIGESRDSGLSKRIGDFEVVTVSNGYELKSYLGNEENLIVPDAINGRILRSIGRGAFENNTRLKSVEFGKKIEKIQNEVFVNCSNLTTVTINGMTEISPGAFRKSSVRTLNIIGPSRYEVKDGVLYDDLGQNVTLHTLLAQYKDAQSYKVEDFVSKIGSFAFENCKKMNSLILTDYVKELDPYAFYGLESLTDLDLHQVEKIGSYAFMGLESINYLRIPQSVKKIDSYCFMRMENLKTLEFDCALDEVPSYAFMHCDELETIKFNKRIKTLESYAFHGADSVRAIDFSQGVSEVRSYAFSHCESLQELTFPNTIVDIESYSIIHCAELKTVTFDCELKKLDSYTISHCDNLETIIFNKKIDEIGDYTFSSLPELKRIVFKAQKSVKISKYALTATEDVQLEFN